MSDRRRAEPEPSATETEESFVSRWSRRKREADREREAARRQRAAPAESDTQRAQAPEDPKAGEPSGPSDADLPPAEALGPDSDYSGYLSGRVSEELRRAALRRLFHLPQFNIPDGLDDYDEDYRSFTRLGDTITADMRHHEQRLREKARQREEEARRAAGEGADEEPADAGATPGDEGSGDATAGDAGRDAPAASDDTDGDSRDA